MNTCVNSLNNIKMAVFVFENVLAISVDEFEKDENNREGACVYENFVPENYVASVEVAKLVDYLKSCDVREFCLLGKPMTSLDFRAKKVFVKRHYGDMFDFYNADTQSLRMIVVRTLRELNKFKPEETLYVCADKADAESMKKDGVVVMSIDEVKQIDYNDYEMEGKE